jgi:hypothetical protein
MLCATSQRWLFTWHLPVLLTPFWSFFSLPVRMWLQCAAGGHADSSVRDTPQAHQPSCAGVFGRACQGTQHSLFVDTFANALEG